MFLKMKSKFSAIRLLLFALLLSLSTLSAQDAGQGRNPHNALKQMKEVVSAEADKASEESNTWFKAGWAWVCKVSEKGWDAFSGFVKRMLFDDLHAQDANWTVIIVLLAILSIMIGSGCWAASIAQMRRHPRIKFFFLGFFTFFGGPVWMLLNLKIKGEDERLAKLAEEAAAKQAEKEEQKRLEAEGRVAKGEVKPAVSEDGIVWDSSYFNSIARREDGTPAGPWQVTYNGVTVRVNNIVEVLPECIQVNMVNQEGTALVGRIPYSRIESWDMIPE